MSLADLKRKGGTLYRDPKGEFQIDAGDIYEAKTTMGHTNLLVALRLYDNYILYAHGDKCKKVYLNEFVRAIEAGDLVLRWPDEIDKERLSLAIIMLEAISNRRSFEETLHLKENEADEYYMKQAERGMIIQ